MHKIKKLIDKLSFHNQVVLLLVAVISVAIILFNIGSSIVVKVVLSDTLEKRVDYNLKRIMNNFNARFLSVSDILDTVAVNEQTVEYIAKDKNERELYSNKKEIEFIKNLCEMVENSVAHFEFLSIMDDDGVVLRYGNAYDKSIDKYEAVAMKDIYNRLDVGKIKLNGPIEYNKQKYDNEDKFYIFSKKYRLKNKAAIISIGVSEKAFGDMLMQHNLQDSEDVIIIGNENSYVIFSSSIESEHLAELSEKAEENEGSFLIKAGGKKINVVYRSSYLAGDRYLYLIDESKEVKKYAGIRVLNILFGLFVLAASVFIVRAIVIRMLTRLVDFSNKLSNFENELMEASVKNNIQIENVRHTQSIYDDMFERIKKLMTFIQTKEKELSSIEKKALQEQINPHFLYNTLEAIRMVSEMHDDEIVSEMILILGRLLRYGLSLNNEGLVELMHEFSNIENYVTLMKFRLRHNIEIVNTVDKSLYDVLIPKITLQPIIENSFYHGNIGRKSDGIIRISAETEGDTFKLTIEDNGDGFDKSNPDLNKLDNVKTEGIGLRNVDRRLKLYFGKTAGLSVESTPGIGTSVTITMPQQRR